MSNGSSRRMDAAFMPAPELDHHRLMIGRLAEYIDPDRTHLAGKILADKTR